MSDPYVYPNTHVLINLKGIKDHRELRHFENSVVTHRIDELKEKPISGNYDQEHLKKIHHHLFKDVYPSAGQAEAPFSGEFRTIGIKKEGDNIHYPHPNDPVPEDLKSRLNYAFSELKKDNLSQEKDLVKFTQKLTKHTAEIWECHPFRDGNTRTTFQFAEGLAQSAGFKFDKDVNLRVQFRPAIAEYARGNQEPFEKLMKTMVVPSQSQDKAVELTVTDRIDRKQYLNAVSKVYMTEKAIVKALYPNNGNEKLTDKDQINTVNRALFKHAPESVSTIVKYREQSELATTFDRLQKLSEQTQEARDKGRSGSENQLLKTQSVVLRTLLNNKNVIQHATSDQKEHLQQQRDSIAETLSKNRDHDISR